MSAPKRPKCSICIELPRRILHIALDGHVLHYEAADRVNELSALFFAGADAIEFGTPFPGDSEVSIDVPGKRVVFTPDGRKFRLPLDFARRLAGEMRRCAPLVGDRRHDDDPDL